MKNEIEKIGKYKVLRKIADSTREVFLVEYLNKVYVLKTLTFKGASKSDDFFLPRDVQEQIETELDRWEKFKGLGFLNEIIEHGRDNDTCCTCYIVQPYLKTVLDQNEELYNGKEDTIKNLAGILYNKLEETELWLDEITYEEITKPSSWGINEEGELKLIDYGV